MNKVFNIYLWNQIFDGRKSWSISFYHYKWEKNSDSDTNNIPLKMYPFQGHKIDYQFGKFYIDNIEYRYNINISSLENRKIYDKLKIIKGGIKFAYWIIKDILKCKY